MALSASIIKRVVLSTTVAAMTLTSASSAWATDVRIEDSKSFRNLFLSLLKESKESQGQSLTSLEEQKLFHLATPALLKGPDTQDLNALADSARAGKLDNNSFPASVTNAYKQTSPLDIHKEANRSENGIQLLSAGELQSLKSKLTQRSKKMTIVLVPGIFGEFINAYAFDEVMRNENTNGKKLFKNAVWNAKQRKSQDAIDYYLNIHNMTANVDLAGNLSSVYQKAELNDVIEMSSIDENGQTLANVILFKTPSIPNSSDVFSLESLGDIEEKARIFTRRLEKFLRIMKDEGAEVGDLAFVGYSRGTVVSLDMLAKALKNNSSWLPQVKAMISLGGVAFGSDAADDIPKLGTAANKQIEAVKKLVNELQPDHKKFFENVDAIARFMKTAVDANIQPLPTNPLKLRQALVEQAVQVQKTIEGLKNKDQSVDTSASLKLAGNMLNALLDIKSLPSALSAFNDSSVYVTNVKRAKLALSSVVTGVSQLQTSARLQWWASNRIPTEGITYYAISGTMANPKAQGEAELVVENAPGFNSNLQDDKQLLGQYLGFINSSKSSEFDSGVRLNDSQVAVHKVQFWPDVISALSVKLPGGPIYADQIHTKFLGIMGSHHWGLALPIVSKMQNNATNPVPRSVLIKALATQVAADQP